jgi:hypothetical protein
MYPIFLRSVHPPFGTIEGLQKMAVFLSPDCLKQDCYRNAQAIGSESVHSAGS